MGTAPFIGRRAELEQALEWLAETAALVTLTGPPGIGKSRLAGEVSARWAGGEVLTISGDGDFEAADLLRTLGARLGLRRRADEDEAGAAAALGEALAQRSLLIVLDDFDLALPRARALLETWTSAPGVRWLLTSRGPSGLSRERALRLEPLSENDALALFAAAAAGSSAPMARADEATVREIARCLECLPLALELAARRMGLLSPAALLARLNQQPGLLRAPGAEPARHSTLRAAVAWSWELLDPAEQEALAALSVFRGGFTFAAAEAILEPEADALEVVEALRRRSFLRREVAPGELRLRLYESARRFAAPTRQPVTDARHAGWLLSTAERWMEEMHREGDAAACHAALVAEHENLLAALSWAEGADPPMAVRLALALDAGLILTGPYFLRYQVLERAAACLPLEDAELGARGRLALAVARYDQGRFDEALAELEKAAATASPLIGARVLHMRGLIAHDRKEWSHAEVAWRDALEQLRAMGEACLSAPLLNNLALLAAGRGELVRAAELIESSLLIDDLSQGSRRINLGQVRHLQGRASDARVHLRLAHQRCEAVGERFYACVALAAAALLELDEGNLAEAEAHLGAGEALEPSLGDARLRALLRSCRAAFMALRGAVAEAEAAMHQARLALQAVEDEPCRDLVGLLGGFIDLAHGRAEHARARLDVAQGPLVVPEVQVAARLLRRALDGHSKPRELRLHAEGDWFQLGSAPPVSIARRKALRRMLVALAGAQEVLDVEALLRAGWPGESPSPESGAQRVYVALSTLRKLGLDDVLLHRDGGYQLDPAVRLLRQESAQP